MCAEIWYQIPEICGYLLVGVPQATVDGLHVPPEHLQWGTILYAEHLHDAA